MPTETDHRGIGRRLLAARERRDARNAALVGALVSVVVALGLYLGAARIDSTSFWQDHFEGGLQPAAGVYGALLVAGSLAPALWPRAWEGALAARGLRMAGVAVLFYTLLGLSVAAPGFGAAAATLALLSLPVTALGLVRELPRTLPHRGLLYVALAVTTLAALAGGLVLWLVDSSVGRALAAGMLALPYVLALPLALRRVRHAMADDGAPAGTRGWAPAQAGARHPLDLSAGTIEAPGGLFGVFVTVTIALLVIVFVAPGVPVGRVVGWAAFVFSLPLIVRGVLRRRGLAAPRAVLGPPELRVHNAVVEHLRDAALERLDDTLERWLRTGRGRRALAQALSDVLGPTVPRASPAELEAALKTMPRGRSRAEERGRALAALLGGTSLLELRKGAGAARPGPDVAPTIGGATA